MKDPRTLLNKQRTQNTQINTIKSTGMKDPRTLANTPTQMSATPTFKTVDEALEYAKANNINVSNSSVENAKKAENANKLKNEIPEENIIEMKRKGIGDVIGDTAENLWVNTLGGTANTINALNSVNEKLAGRDTTSIDAQNLLDYKNNNQKWYQPAIDAYRNIGSFVNPLTKNITFATSFGQTPNSAYSRLEQIYKANPNNLKLKKLYEAITNGTYTGTKEELQQELNDIQISLYNEFVDKYTRDEAEAVAKRQQRNKDEYGAFGEMAMNAFGQVGNMVPSMLTSVIAPPVGMATLGLNAGGNAMGQAINEGAGYNEAMAYGTLSGLAEAGIETLSGGLSNKLMNVKGIFNPSNLTAKIGNRFLRGAANTVLDVTGEGIEEVAAAFIDPILQRLTYDSSAPMATGEELWLSFRDSILPTLLMQGGGVALNKVNEYHAKQVEKIKNSNLPQEQKADLINKTTAEKDKIINEIKNAQQPIQNVTPQSSNTQVQQQTNEVIPQQTENQQNTNIVQNNVSEKLNDLAADNNNITGSQISDLVNEIVGEEFKGIDIDEDENAYDRYYERIDELYKEIENGLTQIGYEYDRNIEEYIPTDERLEGKLDNIDFKYNERATSRLQEKQLEAIRDDLENLVYSQENDNGVSVSLQSSKASADAHYIDIYDEKNDNVKVIRVGNHFKEGTSGKADYYIWMDEYSSIKELENAVNNIIATAKKDIVNAQDLQKTGENDIQNYVNNQNIMPSVEQLQARDLKQGEEISNTLNMKKPKLEDIAELTPKDAEILKVNYTALKNKDTNKERRFTQNAKSSKIISQEIKDKIDVSTYEVKSNLETLAKMKEKLDVEGNTLISKWDRKGIKDFTDEDIALGAILMERYQQRAGELRAEGKTKEAQEMIEATVDVVEKLRDVGTERGRSVQIFAIFQRLTPEGMMMYQSRKIENAFKELSQKQTGKWVEQNKEKFKLTVDDAQFIEAKVLEAQYAPTERQKQIALAEIESRINDKLPPEAGQSVKAFRRIAMLFNPKTQVRNVAGNITVMPLNYVTDLVATGIDKAIAKRTGVRTTTLPNVKTIGKGFVKGVSETIDDYRRGIRTTPTGSRYEIQNNAKSFNENTNSKTKNAINNKLNAIDRILSTTLELGDRPFYEAAYQNALEGQMKANKVTEPTQEMIDIASNVALAQTWQDNNEYTKAVLGARTMLNKVSNAVFHTDAIGFGLGDLIIPFAKTPANLTKAMVEYSPWGAIEALANYNDMRKAISRGDMTAMQQKKFVTSVGKTIAGTLLYVIAGALVQGGAVTGSSDDDKDVANFEKNVLGIQPYSIKIGDKTYTYNWAQPLATPFAVMADTYKMSEENTRLDEILINAFKVAGEQLVANSFLQGIQDLFSNQYGDEGITARLIDAVADMPAQFTPTLLGQIATQFDATKRQTFENGDTVGTMLNEVKNKIPGAKNTLAPQVNTFGEEIQNYGGDNNPFNVFLNPANISSANASDTQKELYALYEVTKDKTIFPRQAPYSVEGGGEKVTLSSQDRATFQKTSGQYVTENLGALFDSNFYKTLDNDKKVEVVAKIVTDANTTARDIWIDTEATKDLAELKNDLKESNIPLIDYYNAWIAQKDEEGEKNILTGKTKTGTKKQARIKAIDEAVGDNLNTWQINKLYDILN